MAFPSDKELARMRKKLEKMEGSLMLHPDASPLEKFRYSICEQFVIYLLHNNLKNKQLARLVGVDESIMSKVLHYRHHRFTTDKLIEMLAKIHPKHTLILKVS